MNAMQLMDARDEAHRATLERIGQEIGYGRAQQMLGEAWDAMLDREYPSPAGTPRSGRGRMGVGANVPVGEVVIGPSPIDGSEGFTMVRWAKERGCPPVGTRLYAEKLAALEAENAALKRDLQYARDGLTKGRTRMREDNERLRAALVKIEAGCCIDPRTVAREALGPNVRAEPETPAEEKQR